MRPREILLMTGMFLLFFIASEIIVASVVDSGAVKRFVLRIAFLVQYSALMYVLFRAGDDD